MLSLTQVGSTATSSDAAASLRGKVMHSHAFRLVLSTFNLLIAEAGCRHSKLSIIIRTTCGTPELDPVHKCHFSTIASVRETWLGKQVPNDGFQEGIVRPIGGINSG
jgi:hypothetical protein